MKTLILFLALCGVASAQDRVMTWRFATYGTNPTLPAAELKLGVRDAFGMFERYFAIDFQETTGAGAANLYVILHAGSLDIGGGQNAYMQWDQGGNWHYRIPNSIYVSGSRKLGSRNQVRIGIAHEIGHVFGAGHTTTTSLDVMNPWIPSTITTFTRSDWNQITRALRPRALTPWDDKRPYPWEPKPAPIAKPDVASVKSNAVATIAPLANDTGDNLTITKATTAFASELRIISKQVTFRPITNKGIAVINYTISDGRSEASSTITVTVVPVYSWQNVNKFDVNNDGKVTSLDALAIINAVQRGEKVDTSKEPVKFYDVNGDGKISSLDALLVTNELNRS